MVQNIHLPCLYLHFFRRCTFVLAKLLGSMSANIRIEILAYKRTFNSVCQNDPSTAFQFDNSNNERVEGQYNKNSFSMLV